MQLRSVRIAALHILCLAVLGLLCHLAPAADVARPNILFLFAEDPGNATVQANRGWSQMICETADDADGRR